jgi:hypothetical protein
MVRWKGRPSSIGPFLLRVLQTGPETWSALEVVKVECGRDGHSEHFYQRTGAIIANADSTDAAIRAGLLALAERLEASNG